MAWKMVQYLHFRILEFPLIFHGIYPKKWIISTSYPSKLVYDVYIDSMEYDLRVYVLKGYTLWSLA